MREGGGEEGTVTRNRGWVESTGERLCPIYSRHVIMLQCTVLISHPGCPFLPTGAPRKNLLSVCTPGRQVVQRHLVFH
jgi:hypothetical protein